MIISLGTCRIYTADSSQHVPLQFVDKSTNCLFSCANLAVKMLQVVLAGNSFFEQYYFLVIIFSVLNIYILELTMCKVKSILRTEERGERPPSISHELCDKN